MSPNPEFDKREASLEIAGQRFTVIQHGSPFEYHLEKSPNFDDPFPDHGDSRWFKIVARDGCPWHVEVITDEEGRWIEVEEPMTGRNGRGLIVVGRSSALINVHVGKTDTKSMRFAKLSISGMREIPIEQHGGSLRIVSAPPRISGAGESLQIQVEAPSDLSWRASWNVDWIQPPMVVRYGSSVIQFAVNENTSGALRFATLTIAVDKDAAMTPRTLKLVQTGKSAERNATESG